MIKRKGDLFSTDARAIGHGVNCQGVMGAGIAKVFKDKFPDNYVNYKRHCELSTLVPGDVYVFERWGRDPHIFNIASQGAPGRHARYDWLFNGSLKAAQKAVRLDADVIAIPQIGCGIGGLEWDKVETLLLAIEVLVPDFQWEVWKQ